MVKTIHRSLSLSSAAEIANAQNWRYLIGPTLQSQIQDFPKEGARFRVKCHVDAIQWGGGVVAEFFRDLKKPMRFSGGGGVVAEIFRGLRKHMQFGGGGGGVLQIFRDLKKKKSIRWGGGSSAEFFFSVTSKRRFTLMGPFKKKLLSRRGGPGPPGPPPESATAL